MMKKKSSILQKMANVTQTCNNCSKQFLIIDAEQAFLQKQGIPLPFMCPACRQARRTMLRGERKLYKATCQQCGKEIIVGYDPATVTQTILCREDYDKYYEENDPIIKEPLQEF